MADQEDGLEWTPISESTRAFYYAIGWLCDERQYTVDKFGTEADRQHIEEYQNCDVALSRSAGWWSQQLDNYLGRVEVLGLDTPNGRQALAKFVSTALGMLSATVEVFGELPEPGVPSGENLTNLRSLT